jgi:hypothetical protein
VYLNLYVIFCILGKISKSNTLLITLSFLILTSITFFALPSVYGAEAFPINGKPFGVSYDDWISKYFKWDFSLSTDQFKPRAGGCLVNNVGSMVMLMNTVEDSPPEQQCKITSKQGIMIPLWIAWCDSGNDLVHLKNPSAKGDQLDQELTNCARSTYNLGNIVSEVLVDGHRVANLNVKLSLDPISGALNYNKNSLNNITEIYTKGFTATLPPNSHQASNNPGTWRAGSQGWWVFLKPLPIGEHKIFYNIRVTPTGALTSPGTNPHFADIAYSFHVIK